MKVHSLENLKSPIFFTILLVFLSLNFTLSLGFISDDSYNAQFKGYLIAHDQSLSDFFYSRLKEEFTTGSRLSIFAMFYNHSIYYLTQNEVIIKFINLSLICLNLFLFYIYLKNLSKNKSLPLGSVLFLSLLIQIRPWHDPIIAFTFLFPVMFNLVLFGLITFQIYLKSKNYFFYFLGALSYFLSCLTYEIPYFLAPLFFITALNFNKNFKKSFLDSLPFILISIFCILWVFYQKEYANASNWRTDVYLGISFWEAFMKQIFSSLPFSYFLFGSNLNLKFTWFDSIFLFIFPMMVYKIFLFISDKSNISKFEFTNINILLIALILIFIPALITALSGHQEELVNVTWGFGYLPVYIQYFGVSILLSLLLNYYLKKVKLQKKSLLILTLIFSLLLILNYGSNKKVSVGSNADFKYPRELFTKANESGFFNEIKRNDLIFNPFFVPSDHYLNFMMLFNKKVNVCDINVKEIFNVNDYYYKKCFQNEWDGHNYFKINHKGSLSEYIPIRNVWFTTYEYDIKGIEGFFYLAKVEKIIIDHESKTFVSIQTRDLKEYDKFKNVIQKITIDSNRLFDMQKFNLSRNHTFNSRKQSRLREYFDVRKYYFDGIGFVWGGGAFAPEGNLIWTNGKAVLKVFNFTNDMKSILISFSIISPTGRASTIFINESEHYLKPQEEYFYKNFINLGKNPFTLKIRSDDTFLNNGDPRKIVFGILNYKQYDPRTLDPILLGQSDNTFEMQEGTLYIKFINGWSFDEGQHRWSNQSSANIEIFNPSNKEINSRVSFSLGAIKDCDLKIIFNDEMLQTVRVGKNKVNINHELLLKSGKNIITIISNKKPIKPNNNDLRKLMFSLHDFKFLLEN